MQEVRERAAFVCDIGSTPRQLASKFPHHDFAHLPDPWWHDGVESTPETVSRANGFRLMMSGRADSRTTLLISHWGFILALTGASLSNGEILEYDPATAAPERLVWIP
jgi:broad specificity phosphatase PhoE